MIKNALEPLDCTVGPDGRDTMDADPSIVCDSKTDVTYRWGWHDETKGIRGLRARGLQMLEVVSMAGMTRPRAPRRRGGVFVCVGGGGVSSEEG